MRFGTVANAVHPPKDNFAKCRIDSVCFFDCCLKNAKDGGCSRKSIRTLSNYCHLARGVRISRTIGFIEVASRALGNFGQNRPSTNFRSPPSLGRSCAIGPIRERSDRYRLDHGLSVIERTSSEAAALCGVDELAAG